MPIPVKDQQNPSDAMRPCFLFADDDLPILTLFKGYFSPIAEIILAVNGEDAHKKIAAQSIDVIISDVDMPVLNGIDLFRRLYAEDPAISKRFIFCTGGASPELLELCSKYNIPCIDKPISLFTLQAELLERCHGLHR